jgi:uncharacterized low-complexity protein
MKATKILSTGALAMALTLGGLSVQGHADSQTDVKGDAQKSMQGAEHKCGSGNCGASKPDDQKDKTASDKQENEKNAKSKGASHSCGASKCG